MKHRLKSILHAMAFAGAAFAATSAMAQDYTVTATSGRWVPVPSGTTAFPLTGDDVAAALNSTNGFPPFAIGYYGVRYTSGTISTNGTISFTNTSASYPGTSGPFASGNSYDGMIEVAHADDYGTSSGSTVAAIYCWTDGVAPNRRFIVAWVNWSLCCTFSGGNNFQVQFYENNGRIVMAYTGSWASSTYTVGIDEPGTGRFNRPPAPGSASGQFTFTTPTNDWQFDPRITSFTGTVGYDRYVADATGIGNTIASNQPLAGARVDLKDAGGTTVASAYADPSGFFSIEGQALVGTTVGSIAVTAQSLACVVKPTSAGAVTSHTIATNVSFSTNTVLGTVIIGEAADPGGAKRGAFNIASAIQTAANFVSARSTDPIPPIDVLYDPSSSSLTAYTAAFNTTPAFMRVGSSGSANPDQWDNAVIQRAYGRHLLTAIAAKPQSGVDPRFDAVTDDQNAFAEGFGYYIASALNPNSVFVDAVSSSSASGIDLESPTLTSPPGSSVVGSVAAALYDLTDDANESWDTVDGRTALLDRVIRVADTLTVPATADNFYRAWGNAGFDGVALAANFIHHNLIPDDSDESNSTQATAFRVSQFGFIRKTRILNLYDEDWYVFNLPAATDQLTAQVVYDRTLAVSVLLELRGTDGTILSTGVGVGDFGPVVAQSGALPAGDYLLRFKHLSGVNIPNYTLQAFSRLVFSSDRFDPWTVGRPYNVPVAMSGGIPPYDLTVELPFVKPPGLILDGVNARVVGTPTVAGTFGFVLSARDGADPANIASGPITFIVNGVVTMDLENYVAFPLGKAASRKALYVGGTPPFTAALQSGALPDGVSFAPGELRYTGTATTPGSSTFSFVGTDVAGSKDTGTTTGVTCVPVGTVALAGGKAAAGVYVDALVGTSIGLSLKTAKGKPKRALQGYVIDADGSHELDVGAKGGSGKAGVGGFTAPSTGRFYFVVASDSGDATELVTTAKVVPAKAGKGGTAEPNFVAGKLFYVEIGALPNAALTFTAKPDKSGLALKSSYMLDPNGVITALAEGEVTEKAGGVTIQKTFPTGGTWKVVIGAYAGAQGGFKYSFKLAQPKGGVFVLD